MTQLAGDPLDVPPRLKRPVGRRLAYAAARMLKKQQRASSGAQAEAEASDGAMTGPTISGCSCELPTLSHPSLR